MAWEWGYAKGKVYIATKGVAIKWGDSARKFLYLDIGGDK